MLWRMKILPRFERALNAGPHGCKEAQFTAPLHPLCQKVLVPGVQGKWSFFCDWCYSHYTAAICPDKLLSILAGNSYHSTSKNLLALKDMDLYTFRAFFMLIRNFEKPCPFSEIWPQPGALCWCFENSQKLCVIHFVLHQARTWLSRLALCSDGLDKAVSKFSRFLIHCSALLEVGIMCHPLLFQTLLPEHKTHPSQTLGLLVHSSFS